MLEVRVKDVLHTNEEDRDFATVNVLDIICFDGERAAVADMRYVNEMVSDRCADRECVDPSVTVCVSWPPDEL
jgi:hypothetical protein